MRVETVTITAELLVFKKKSKNASAKYTLLTMGLKLSTITARLPTKKFSLHYNTD